MKTTTRIQLTALALLMSSIALAQTKPAGQGVEIEKGIDTMFNGLDTDKNRQLSFEEFKKGVVAERRQSMVLQQLSGIFSAADANKNGSLEALEFNNLPGIKQAKEPKPRFSEFDTDKDQKLSFREYVGFVQKMTQAPKK
jgi:Ca2+-binding EF-hand superfamily protein